MSYHSSSRSSSRNTDCKVYVGDLGNGAAKGELERAFSYYGPLRTVWVARNPPGFAFVEYEDARDAEDAVKGMDGKVLCGSRIRVELSTGMSRKTKHGRPSRRHFDPQDRCYQCGDRGHYASEESKGDDDEEDGSHKQEQASPRLTSSMKSTLFSAQGKRQEGEVDQISTCPHCHLALPVVTLRWHEVKCQIHVNLK